MFWATGMRYDLTSAIHRQFFECQPNAVSVTVMLLLTRLAKSRCQTNFDMQQQHY
jgi:hypothetical protein